MCSTYKILPIELYNEMIQYIPGDVLRKHNWSRPVNKDAMHVEDSSTVPNLPVSGKHTVKWITYEDELNKRRV